MTREFKEVWLFLILVIAIIMAALLFLPTLGHSLKIYYWVANRFHRLEGD